MSDYRRLGVCWRESSSSKIVNVVYRDTGYQIAVEKCTNETTYDSAYLAAFSFGKAHELILRLADNNTNRIVSISQDGYNWTVLHTVGRTDYMTANQYGIYVEAYSADVSMSVLSWDEA